MKADFIPKRAGNLDAFEENFLSKLDDHVIVLGLDPIEVARTKDILTGHRTSYSTMNTKRQVSYSANEEQRIKRNNATRELRRIAKKIKSSVNYDKSIGDDLGIIGAEALKMIPEDMKPVLTANFNGQEVVIKYTKARMDGVKIYCRRDGEKEFKFLTTATSARYADNTPKADPDKPEQREYYAIYIFDYVEVGHRSDLIKAVVP